MMLRARGREVLKISDLRSSEYSANIEDTSTFNRLKEELQQNGLLEIPVVFYDMDSNEYRILAGHHRVRAWQELGHDSVPCEVVEGILSPEEEFNLVNNLNTVRGSVLISELKEVIRKHALDPEKLNVFRFPMARFVPRTAAALPGGITRRAEIRRMAQKIAPAIAEVLLDKMENEEGVIVFVAENVVAAIVRLRGAAVPARKGIAFLKRLIAEALEGWVDGGVDAT